MRKSLIALAVGASLVLTGCGETQTSPSKNAKQADTKVAAAETKAVPADTLNNPLLVKSSLQYEAPQYDKIQLDHYLPAFKQGIQAQADEIAAIANNSDAPTFDNTIVAMEKTGALLRRAIGAFFNITGTISGENVRAIQSEVIPLLTAHGDNIDLNPQLFARVEAVYNNIDKLTGEDKRLTELTYKGFVRAGAKLDDAQKAKVRELNAELAKLTNDFGQNLMKVTKDAAVIVEDKAQLVGLPDTKIASLAAAAEAAGMKGKYLITLQNTTRQPIMTSLDNRELREKVWQASANRGMDLNGPLAIRLAELRAEKAKLMGYPNWATYVLNNQMAKTPDAVLTMLGDMAPKIVAKNELEAVELKALMSASGVQHDLKPWDWTYYAEKVRAQKYDLDESEVRNYFEINNVLEKGIFYALERQFGITFKERNDLPTYHPDVRTYEVFEADGTSIGLFYADYFAREGKRGGAWMNAFVGQNHLLGKKPVIVNVMNIPKPAEGQPALVSFNNVTTMFHEMGHGMHGMLSDVKYPKLAGTAVSRDYVEFPSQFQEDWAIHPDVLANYAKHYQTGESIPQD
ncbi:M3 family metallopeptidase, partial [Shewanella gelidii]